MRFARFGTGWRIAQYTATIGKLLYVLVFGNRGVLRGQLLRAYFRLGRRQLEIQVFQSYFHLDTGLFLFCRHHCNIYDCGLGTLLMVDAFTLVFTGHLL